MFTGIFGGIVYVFTLLYPVFTALQRVIVDRLYTAPDFLLLGMYMVIVVELVLYRKTPSNHHLVLGFLLIAITATSGFPEINENDVK